MKRKVLLGLLLSAIAIFAFIACSNETPKEEDKGTAPVITDAFFVSKTYDKDTDMQFLPATQTVSYTKLDTIDRYATLPESAPYYICIKCSDPDLDIQTMNEISIPDLDCTLNKYKKMSAKDSFFIWAVCYTTKEIPDNKLSSDGKYTFKYQLVDEKGNKSNVFEVTVNAANKK